MSRYTVVNPFLSDAQDPETVYYNGQIMCKDNTLPLAKYIDAQDVPILKDVGRFTVLLTQLEMNNVTNNLPIYEMELANFTAPISYVLNNTTDNVNTVYTGWYYNDINNYWTPRPHRLTLQTYISLYLNGVTLTPVAPVKSTASATYPSDNMYAFNIFQFTLSNTIYGTIFDPFSTNIGNIYYVNVNSTGTELIIVADSVGVGSGNAVDVTINGVLYPNIDITSVNPISPVPIPNTAYVYTFSGVPQMPVQELSQTYTTLNASSLQFWFDYVVSVTQPTYQVVTDATNTINTFSYSQIYTNVPAPMETIVGNTAYLYSYNSMTDILNYAFFSFFYYINRMMYNNIIQTIGLGLSPGDVAQVATNTPYVVYENNVLKLFLDPYGFPTINVFKKTMAGLYFSPTCVLNPSNSSSVINELEGFNFHLNSDFKLLLNGFSAFLNGPDDYILAPDVFKLEPIISNITGLPLSLSSRDLYIANTGVHSSGGYDTLVLGKSGAFLTMQLDTLDAPFKLGNTYFVNYVTTANNFKVDFSKQTNAKLPWDAAHYTVLRNIDTATTAPYVVSIINSDSVQTMTIALEVGDTTQFKMGNFYYVKFDIGTFEKHSGGGPSYTLSDLTGYYECLAVNSSTTGVSVTFRIQNLLEQFGISTEILFVSTNAQGQLYEFNNYSFSPTLLSGIYELYSINTGQNAVTFKINNDFVLNNTFSYYKLETSTDDVTNIYSPLPYTTNPKTVYDSYGTQPLQAKYKEQVNMVLQSEIQNANINWFPIDAIVITTTNIPVQKEYNTKVLQATETNNVGNNTNKGTFLNILYTLPLSSKTSLITLPMIPEHKKNYMMTLNTELKVIDVQFWWKKRLTNELIPLTMPKNSSILFKLRFRKER